MAYSSETYPVAPAIRRQASATVWRFVFLFQAAIRYGAFEYPHMHSQL